MRGSRTLAGLGLLAALATAGCEQSQGLGEIRKAVIDVLDFEDQVFNGRERREFRATVTADMVHPSFEGHWTFRDPEKPLDIYVIRADLYDPNRPLDPQDPDVRWSSIKDAIGGLGQLRATEMHIHPTPGDWVILFYNPRDPVATTRATVSAEVRLTYFTR